ncbi:MAG TPA: twin-arginine translocation pathway signal, partial [Paraburkholderia sp.]|nr:twin-arginine translocation pathway signal [Paraburkholderia sp.]
GSRVSSLSLVYDDGTETGKFWQADSGDPVEEVSVSGRKLTTFTMWSVSRFYDYDLGSILFGFSRDPFDIPPQIQDLFYVTALVGRDSRSRHLPATVSNALKARRDTFWRDISQQVPKPDSAVGGSAR